MNELVLTEREVNFVVEPLSEATATVFKPESLWDHDYLVIGYDADKERFLLAPSYGLIKITGAHQTLTGEKIEISTWMHPSAQAWRWMKRIPELYSNNGSKSVRSPNQIGPMNGPFVAAATDFTALVIHHVWPRSRIIFDSDMARDQYDYLLTRFRVQTKCAQLVAKFKGGDKNIKMPTSFVDHPDRPLADFQRCGLAASVNEPCYALFMEQGTGKTPIAVARASTEARLKDIGMLPGSQPGPYRILVICPRNLRTNWKREFIRFSTLQGKVGVLRGGSETRVRCLIDTIRVEEGHKWSAAILSMDSLESMSEILYRVPWDLLIVDESQHIKSKNTNRWKQLRHLQDAGRIRSTMILTGTPIANSIFDIWAQLEILGKGMSGFANYERFKAFHGKFQKVHGSPIQKVVGITALPLLQERLARVAFMLTKAEANLGLPEKVYDIVEVDMTPKQRDVYNDLRDLLVAEIETLLAETEEGGNGNAAITAENILTKLLRLAQVTSGHVRLDGPDGTPGPVIQVDTRNPKVESVIEMITEEGRDPNGKTIIWGCFIEDLRVLSEELTKKGIKHSGYHKSIVEESRYADAALASDHFNKDPDCKVFLANPQSGGEGLNILGYDPLNPDNSPTYVDHVIYFSSNWSMIQRSQSEDRCHRRGTRCNVRITDLVVPSTVDEEIRARVLEKRQKALLIQDVRSILEKLRRINDE
jgi:SNF2 family DNA or RNA helicase